MAAESRSRRLGRAACRATRDAEGRGATWSGWFPVFPLGGVRFAGRQHRLPRSTLPRAAEEAGTHRGYPTPARGARMRARRSDLSCTTAELVYSTTLLLPGEVFTPASNRDLSDPTDYVTRLKEVMEGLRATPPRTARRDSYVSTHLDTCTHVFVRHDAVRTPLQQPYGGPYKVVKQGPKQVTVTIRGNNQVIATDRLKPAFVNTASDADFPLPILPPATNSSPRPSPASLPTQDQDAPLGVELNADLEGPKHKERFKGWERFYTEESFDHDARTHSNSRSTVLTDFGARAAERLSYARSAIAELAALRWALSLTEAESAPDRLVIQSDSKAALTQLANLERASPLTGELANAAIMLQRQE
ncbi:hypothetical protein HPB47_015055 [Ixodes persulcatus]|uniref:Uncharacterized protein n=1 Tax=Ixodes persulcatus TaxID=34615 RepID=A0AC60QVQ3_IXOPE|nr:hypothetical protein HPB47_015055 [Ixodes persulcatus]